MPKRKHDDEINLPPAYQGLLNGLIENLRDTQEIANNNNKAIDCKVHCTLITGLAITMGNYYFFERGTPKDAYQSNRRSIEEKDTFENCEVVKVLQQELSTLAREETQDKPWQTDIAFALRILPSKESQEGEISIHKGSTEWATRKEPFEPNQQILKALKSAQTSHTPFPSPFVSVNVRQGQYQSNGLSMVM